MFEHQNDLDWQSYEEIVKNIYQELGKQIGLKIECYGNSCRCQGKSDVWHQIDVLTSHSDGIHTYKTAIECKYWEDKINKDILMKVHAIGQDCNLQKVVVVSKLGFTPDAIQWAKSSNVGLVELRKPLTEDLINRIPGITINLNLKIPEIKLYHNIIDQAETQERKFNVNVYNNDTYYLFEDGSNKTIMEIINDFGKEVIKFNKVDEIITKQRDFPDNTYLISHELQLNIQVKAVVIQGILRKNNIELVEIKDKVWLMMKFIFEEKMFTISSDQKMREVPYSS